MTFATPTPTLADLMPTPSENSSQNETGLPTGNMSPETIKFAMPFVRSAISTFESMLGCDCTPGEIREIKEGRHQQEITAAIGLSGGMCGAIAFSCKQETASIILNRMTGMETTEIDEFVRDAVGEVANMIGGFGKRELDDYELKLGLPQVIVGSQYNIFTPRWSYHVWVPLRTELGDCTLEIGFDQFRRG